MATNREVLLAKSHTAGLVITDNQYTGRAIMRAMRSAAAIPMRLGTSSPRTRVRYVTIMSIVICAILGAIDALTPILVRICPKSLARASPENIPVNIPISVIPICIVDKKISGSDANLITVCAPLLPFSLSFSSFVLRADNMAISDIENIPLSNISPMIIII